MTKRKRHITGVISRWLLLVVGIAYVVSAALVLLIQYRRVDREYQEDLSDLLFRDSANMAMVFDPELYTQAVLYVDTLGFRMQADPDDAQDDIMLSFQTSLDTYAVSEMDLVNAAGLITVSTDEANVGYDLHTHPELSEFLNLLGAEDRAASYLDGPVLHDGAIVRYSAAKIPEVDALLLCGVTAQDIDDMLLSYASISQEFTGDGKTELYLTATEDQVIRASTGNLYNGRMLADLGISMERGREYSAVVEKQRINGVLSYVALDNAYGFIKVIVIPMKVAMKAVSASLLSTLAVMTVVFIVLYFAILRLMKTVVLNRLAEVNQSLAVITSGDLEEKVNVRDTVEFDSLSDGVNATVDRLKEYIAEAAARFDKDLAIAREIQLSCLPDVDALPSNGRFTLAASMEPAKEVGGDFYDFYYLDEHTLALVIADVSGKSIPGAMYMMRSKALIKNRAQQGGSPAEIIADVNEALCEGNDAGMFVTVWFAVLDLDTGRGVAVNAGHEHPALRRGDGSFELVKYRHSPAVAAMEGVRFRQHEFELRSGECIFVYTDGVAEATDTKPELFGEARMLAALNEAPAAPPKEILRAVKASIDGFVGEAEQFDDITMLCLEYFGPEK